MSMKDLFNDMKNDPSLAKQSVEEVGQKYNLTEKEKTSLITLHNKCEGLEGKELEERINAMYGSWWGDGSRGF